MRGYTSLLSHIIGSNADVMGYSEMHQSYRSHFGLLQLRQKSKVTTSSLKVTDYLFDKLLHNKYQITKRILLQQNVYPIIMVREPEPTMKSIMNMGEKYTKLVRWYRDPEAVKAYYVKRLFKLEEIAKKCDGKALFINAQNIIEQPDLVLSTTTKHLNLQTPLSKEYDTFSLTGAKGAGDPSKHIQSGKIVKQRDGYDAIEVDQELLTEANAVYEQTVVALQSLCKTI